MNALTTFLRAQLDEDERIARAATAGPWVWQGDEYELSLVSETARWRPTFALRSVEQNPDGYPEIVVGVGGREDPYLNVEPQDQEHIATWNPVRALAEVKVKRLILAGLIDTMEGDYAPWNEDLIELLAQPYAGREGWQDQWELKE